MREGRASPGASGGNVREGGRPAPKPRRRSCCPSWAPGARADLQAGSSAARAGADRPESGRQLLAGQGSRAWSGWCVHSARAATTRTRPYITWGRCSPTLASGLPHVPSCWTLTGEA
uniref:Uncharacterized protein n=1 Tax=Marmota marmota marmota TaxID=9994 RepID=A0A8C5Z3K8_MARMA